MGVGAEAPPGRRPAGRGEGGVLRAGVAGLTGGGVISSSSRGNNRELSSGTFFKAKKDHKIQTTGSRLIAGGGFAVGSYRGQLQQLWQTFCIWLGPGNHVQPICYSEYSCVTPNIGSWLTHCQEIDSKEWMGPLSMGQAVVKQWSKLL